MKVLLVEDDTTKLNRVINFLIIDVKLPREIISVARTTSAATTLLEKESFDLMILDLLLPKRDEDDPAWSSAIDLVTELTEMDTLIKPRYIIGLTQHEAVDSQLRKYFENSLWYIVNYSQIDISWKQQLNSLVKYIAGVHINEEVNNQNVDLCVITALQSEMDQILKLDWHWEKSYDPIDDVSFVKRGRIDLNGRSYSVVASVCQRMGMVAAAINTSKLISLLSPRIIAMTGICAGIRGKTNIGDIILADPCWNWQAGKNAIDDNGPVFKISPHHIPIMAHIRSKGLIFRNMKSVFQEIKDAYSNPPVQTELSFHVGPITSGSAVLADKTIVDEVISKQARDLLGVEMEIYGLYSAAHEAGNAQPTFFAIKSVCDFADEEKNDAYQNYAAYTSARSLDEFIRRYILEMRS